jgi:hypothetical protein
MFIPMIIIQLISSIGFCLALLIGLMVIDRKTKIRSAEGGQSIYVYLKRLARLIIFSSTVFGLLDLKILALAIASLPCVVVFLVLTVILRRFILRGADNPAERASFRPH